MVPQILARIIQPTFPSRTFEITRFGATTNGSDDCSVPIAKAISECTSSGGGHVVIPAGNFLTGPIHLDNNVDLHLEKGAVLRFATDPKL